MAGTVAGKAITRKERIACRILSHLKIDKTTEGFVHCFRNDILLGMAKHYLDGRDPIDWLCWLLEPIIENPEKVDEFVKWAKEQGCM